MKEIKIKIENNEYVVKQSFRSLMLFEEMTGKNANQLTDNLTDLMTLFYCILQAGNKDIFKFSFDQFIDLIDNNQDTIQVFNDYLADLNADTTNTTKQTKKKVKKA
jgi:hypothetical protein